MKKIVSLFVVVLGLVVFSFAQDVPATTTKIVPKQKFTKSTFSQTRIINMQSVEIVNKGSMQFMISHHFSDIWKKGGGSQNLAQMFGLNSGVANTYLSLDYSATSWMNVGLASTGNSKFEGWTKFKVLRQQKGAKNIPVTVALFSLAHVNAAKDPSITLAWNKYSFIHQLLIARKFSDKFSLQVMPTLIHHNLVPYGINNSNHVWSMGLGGRYSLSENKSLTFEYSRQLNMYENLMDKNGNIINYQPDLLSVGMEFNTGGHVFHFYIGSTNKATNIDQLSRNTSSIRDGNFALGFTINRDLF